ncbi:MAG: hypothetical protein PHN89_05375 [Candidatus Pacebacteria bacterium]|nr:hypothetical protein [Candidatus Paceibacterota bacterium]
MSNYLDDIPIPKRFKAPKSIGKLDNEKILNNWGTKEVTEDFSDSPFADRTKYKAEDEII